VYEPTIESKLLFLNNDDYINRNKYEIAKITQDDAIDINTNTLLLKGANDSLVIDDINTPLNIISFNRKNNFHYLTFNSSINTTKNNTRSVVSFDLIRTKINIDYTNGLIKDIGNGVFHRKKISIPGEFIDLSVSASEDTFAIHYNADPLHNKTSYNIIIGNNGANGNDGNPDNMNGDNFSILIDSYTPQYMIYDLQGVLFSQNSYTPWTDGKYTKRIKRLLFIYSTISRENYDFLNTIYLTVKEMTDFIEDNERNAGNNQQTNNLYINNILRNLYNNNVNFRNDFITLCVKKHANHEFILNFNFGAYPFYDKGLNDLINMIFYSFLVYVTFVHDPAFINIDHSVIDINAPGVNPNTVTNIKLFNINNYIRELFNINPLTNLVEYNNLLIRKIKEFLINMRDISSSIYNFLNGVYP
jgi:hypothetical protein